MFRRRVGWYAYPLIYLAVASAVMWQRARITPALAGALFLAWRNIALIPVVVWIAAITIRVLLEAGKGIHRRGREGGRAAASGDQAVPAVPPVRRAHPAVRAAGFAIMALGAAALVWIARPYLTLLFSSDRVAQLERKAEAGAVTGDWIIIPSVLVDAPILEGLSERNLADGIAHLSDTPKPGEGGKVVLEGHNLADLGLVKPNNLFSLLELVGRGARVYVFSGGERHVYMVSRKEYKDVGDPDLYREAGDVSGERLVLITCVSTWSPSIHSRRRTVVVAERIARP